MTTWTTRTLLYSFWSVWPEDDPAAVTGGFFHGRDDIPGEYGGLYAVFLYRCYYFADPRCGPGRGPCRVGRVNLLEGYGSDNAAAKSQGIKQLMAGGGIIVLGTTLIPLLSTLF